MMTALEHLENLAPCTFRCIPAGPAKTSSDEVFHARVIHRLNRPATPMELWTLRASLGLHGLEIEAVYAVHNGFVLYQDRLSNAAGIEALPINRWAGVAKELNESLIDFLDGNDPDHISGSVPFACVPHSGNYFVMPVDGPSAGKVFYANHDGWYESAFATGFNDFVHRVTTNPARVMTEELGCYTRYSDGVTNTQWIPNSVEPIPEGTA